MAYEFKLPDLGEGLTEGEIARWLVAEAGGRIVNAKGEEPLYATLAARHGPLAAGSGTLLEAMAGVVASYAPQGG